MAIKKRTKQPRNNIPYDNLKAGHRVIDRVGHVYEVIYAGLRLKEHTVEFEDLTTKPKRENMVIDKKQYDRCVLGEY